MSRICRTNHIQLPDYIDDVLYGWIDDGPSNKTPTIKIVNHKGRIEDRAQMRLLSVEVEQCIAECVLPDELPKLYMVYGWLIWKMK